MTQRTAVEAAGISVHPAAERFPMLPQDELDDLAADIKEQGLLDDIVLDKDGQILDGRNRLAACQIAEVPPRFTVYEGDDAAAYVIGKNIARRHLSKGQRAMILAEMRLELTHYHPGEYISSRDIAADNNISLSSIGLATAVLHYAPDQVPLVIRGEESLNAAYGIAMANKVAIETKIEKAEQLRSKYSPIASEVSEGRLSLEDALDQMAAQLTEEKRLAEEYDGRVRRANERLNQLLIGWTELTGLPSNPDRDAILGKMNQEARLRVETIEKLFVEASDNVVG